MYSNSRKRLEAFRQAFVRGPLSGSPSSTDSSQTKPSLNLEETPTLDQLPLPENKPRGLQNLEDSGDVDPWNPRNCSFWPPLSSSMMAPGLPGIAEKYSIESVTILSMSFSIFLLTFAVGEMYGRTWVNIQGVEWNPPEKSHSFALDPPYRKPFYSRFQYWLRIRSK
ncbi:hypothetical protein B0H19DRAFT_1058024 [Mycena capillaripes]|nr:hypothetical protein B0H19DRAFT_1058024 [Mycena capillaripes]